jgi:hypothetical protein
MNYRVDSGMFSNTLITHRLNYLQTVKSKE